MSFNDMGKDKGLKRRRIARPFADLPLLPTGGHHDCRAPLEASFSDKLESQHLEFLH